MLPRLQVPPVAQVSTVVVVVGATVVVVVGAMVVVGAIVVVVIFPIGPGLRSFLPGKIKFLVRIAAVLSLLEFSLDPPQAASAIAATVSSANVLEGVPNLLMPRWYYKL